MSVLKLTIKKEWFDMINSGVKKEEYREIKPYWVSRLFKADFGSLDLKEAHDYMKEGLRLAYKFPNGHFTTPRFSTIEFKNGYAKDAPTIHVVCEGITIGEAKPEWSNNWQGKVFVIKLGDIYRNDI
jgi:hypothetical protein